VDCPRFDQVYAAYKALGYKTYDKPYDMNYFGVRSDVLKAGQWDDWIGAFYTNDCGTINYHCWQATTDPSAVHLKRRENPRGTAILVPGQYLGMWKMGLHRGKYLAYVQRRPVKVYRDANRDDILNMGPDIPVQEGLFGINGHKGSGNLDEDSAGCQVVLDQLRNFDLWVELGKKQIATIGVDAFTYTPFTEGQITGR